ncbi:ABC transporter ATP-binding protein, partial [Acinetobacter calcoaceticus]
LDSGKVADIVPDGAGVASEVLRAYLDATDACMLGDMEASDRMGNLQHKLDQLDGWALVNKVNALLSKMRLDPN